MTHYHEKKRITCLQCQEEKISTEFYYNHNRNQRMKTCKTCNKNRSTSYQNKRIVNNDIKFILTRRSGDIRRRCKLTGLEVAKDLNKILLRLWNEQDGKCVYTGKEMSPNGFHTDLYAVTVDKIDPQKGYIDGNLVLCSRISNAMKQNLSLLELRELCSLILKNTEG